MRRSIRGGNLAGALAAAVLLVGGAGCVSSDRSQLATAVTATDIAYAVCAEYRPGKEDTCRGVELPTRAAATAYELCLDYHPGYPKHCNHLREAYVAELRAYLGPHQAPPVQQARLNTPEPPTGSPRQRYATAKAMYVATSRDAQTFEAALLIPNVRDRVAAVLGYLDDDKLKALAAQSKAEAIYWYRYMQELEQGAE